MTDHDKAQALLASAGKAVAHLDYLEAKAFIDALAALPAVSLARAYDVLAVSRDTKGERRVSHG